MNREQATRIWRATAYKKTEADMAQRIRPEVLSSAMDDMADDEISAFIALGMLKLDEPQGGWEKFEEAAIQTLEWMPSSENTSILYEVRELLASAGLKIVEK